MPRILIVDDDSAIRQNLAELLEGSGFSVRVAANGQEGLAAARIDVPDLILCDIMMPVLDGLALADQLRSHPTTAHIPVVFLTGKAEQADLRAGLDLGAEDYLTKPCRIEKVLSVIRMRLARRQVIEERLTESWRELRREVIADAPPALSDHLDAIRSYADVISQHSNSLDRQDLVRISHEISLTAAHLRRLIINFSLHFELASLPSGTVPGIMEGEQQSDVRAVLSSVAEACGADFGRQSDWTLDATEVRVQISGRALDKIILELVDNAFRYSRPGAIVEIRGSVVGNSYQIVIQDHGPGITPARLAQVRGHRYDFLETSSLELGLQIAEKLLALAGSKLRIATEPLQGTIVSFSLPLAPQGV